MKILAAFPTKLTPKLDHYLDIRTWFGAANFCLIIAAWIVCSWWFSELMKRSLLGQESRLTAEYVQSIADVMGPGVFKQQDTGHPQNRKLREMAAHLQNIPGLIRANIYSDDRQVLWSTKLEMIGTSHFDNGDLDEALRGKIQIEINSTNKLKQEYSGLSDNGLFIEEYIPIRAFGTQGAVVGVVEIYKIPKNVLAAVAEAKRMVWIGGFVIGFFAFVTLYLIVIQGAAIFEAQQREVVQLRSSAVIGELASTVAHSLRNPMAAVRTSAELWRKKVPDTDARLMNDVMHEIDRMDDYVLELLRYAQATSVCSSKRVDASETLDLVLARREAALFGNSIVVRKNDIRERPAKVRVDPPLFEHALTSIINNAIEAMPGGGVLDVTLSLSSGSSNVVIQIKDSGFGMAAELIQRISESFVTTKTHGLGMGLPLARNAIERWGGSMIIQSSKGYGTAVTIALAEA